MLQDLRDNSKGLIAKVIIGAIASIFVITGWESVGGLIQGTACCGNQWRGDHASYNWIKVLRIW